MAGTSKKPLSLKLLIDKRSQRVLFAEASKEAVDFLFGLVHLPMGSVFSFLAPNSGVARYIGNLYRSGDSLQSAYLNKTYDNTCTCGGSSTYGPAGAILGKRAKVADRYGTNCRDWRSDMKTAMVYAYLGMETEGATYMVMDDLTVTLTSALSSVELLRKFGVSSLESLEETTVDLGMEKGLELLTASLKSKTALTDVFMKAKTEKGGS